MTPFVRDNIDRITALCQQHGVVRLFLVGSAATGGFEPGRSDYDFLVEFDPGSRHVGGGYFGLLKDLEKLMGVPVHLIERHCVGNPYVRASLERTKVPLYAAA